MSEENRKKEETMEEPTREMEKETGAETDLPETEPAAEQEEAKKAAEAKEAEAAEETAEDGKERKFFKKKKDKKDEKIEELTDRLTRQMAEFDNFRKRTEKEKANMYAIGAKDIIEKMTTDESVLKDIVSKDNDYANNSKLMDSLKDDKSFGDKALGGQNPVPIFSAGVGNIDMSNISSYDQTCAEEFQAAMKDYFDGNTKDYDTALQTFIDKVKTKHPEIEG